MKRSNLYVGLVYLAIGIICFTVLFLKDPAFGSVLAGFGGAGLGGGLVMIAKYVYWSHPRRRDDYRRKLEEETIDLHDERKVKLRDKSGRYAYIISMLIIVFSMMVIPLMKPVVTIDARFMVLYLGALAVGMYIIGLIIYRHLSRKY